MLALLPRAAAELKLVFAARGEADFTEIAQGAVRALGSVDDPSELLLSLDAKIFHILVDEFQDTSISQWELLERLTAGWQPGDGRTLFVVGDPMQSIYRFREAEVGLFLRARREGLPNVKLEPLALKTNFRSQAGIVDWVNASFPRSARVGERNLGRGALFRLRLQPSRAAGRGGDLARLRRSRSGSPKNRRAGQGSKEMTARCWCATAARSPTSCPR